MTHDLTQSFDIADIASSLRRHETSAVELAEEALRRIERGAALNAFALVDAPGALAAARIADAELQTGLDRGPLHGVPVAVKDLIDVAGLPTTCGSSSTFGGTAAEDAEVVTRLRRAGAVIVGKTTLHEFAYGATGDRSVHGASRNPADPDRMSGGSSGGSAVAVAAKMVPLSLGTDTAGSVRVPAALCGVVGLKPAFDAIPSAGVYPLAPSLDHVGLFAASTADVLLGYQALSDQSVRPAPEYASPTVTWISPDSIAVNDPRVEATTRALVGRAGIDVSSLSALPASDRGALFDIFTVLQSREAFLEHEHHLEADRHEIDPEVLARLRAGQEVSAADYDRADEARRRLRSTVADLLAAHDVLALPTVPVVAPAIGARTVRVADVDLEVRAALLSLTSPWNLAGVPAISVPAGEVDGLPVAVQLVTAPGNEHLMFAVARRLEHARDLTAQAG